jgi:hypothetical protein
VDELPACPPDGAALTSLVDLLDRVVARGAVVNGDVIITLAGVDLIRLDLRLLLAAVDEIAR